MKKILLTILICSLAFTLRIEENNNNVFLPNNMTNTNTTNTNMTAGTNTTAINMSSNTTLHKFRHDDIITLDSPSVRNAHILASYQECSTNKTAGFRCGDLLGTSSNATKWIIKQGGAETFCLMVNDMPKVFLYMNVEDCDQSDVTCGNPGLIYADTNLCSIEYSFRFLPVRGRGQQEGELWAIQSGQNPSAYLTFNTTGCEGGAMNNSMGNNLNNTSGCGTVTGGWKNSVDQILETDPQTFIVGDVEEEPVVG
jgi:hypothetical protein